MEEIWKDIKGYEGVYQVSNLGQVKSLERNRKGKNGSTVPVKEIIRKIKIDKYGYEICSLCTGKHNELKHYFVHKLVAKAFPEICGEWFEGCEIHHKDLNPSNNCANNLIVCTKEQHKLFHSTMNIDKRRIPVLQYDLNGNLLKEWNSATQAGQELSIGISSISRCCKGRCGFKTAGGYMWKYKKVV